MSLSTELAFVFMIGAANADGTPEQRRALRRRVKPLLEQYRVDGRQDPVLAVLRDVMGAEWKPSGDWATAIGAFSGQV